MPDFTQAVPFSFILETIGAIFIMIAIGIFFVKKFK